MGDFDDTISSLKKMRDDCLADLESYRSGHRWFRDQIDITDSLIARAQQNLQTFDTLIAAYEAHNA